MKKRNIDNGYIKNNQRLTNRWQYLLPSKSFEGGERLVFYVGSNEKRGRDKPVQFLLKCPLNIWKTGINQNIIRLYPFIPFRNK